MSVGTLPQNWQLANRESKQSPSRSTLPEKGSHVSPNGNSDKERIVALEVGQRDLRDDVREGFTSVDNRFHVIETNHLAHLAAGLNRVQWLLVVFILVYLFGPDAISKIKLLTGL